MSYTVVFRGRLVAHSVGGVLLEPEMKDEQRKTLTSFFFQKQQAESFCVIGYKNYKLIMEL